MELGGRPLVIFNDADMEKAPKELITKFRNGGQSCIASNRIYVQRGIYDAFLEAFVAKASFLAMEWKTVSISAH